MTISHKVIVSLVLTLSAGTSGAEGPPYAEPPLPACQACVTHSCQLVPEIKQIKKTVYEVREVPYCVKRLPPLWTLLYQRGCECEACAECDCVRYKKVLVKREVVCQEVCTTKCVVQEHIQHVPCPPACQK